MSAVAAANSGSQQSSVSHSTPSMGSKVVSIETGKPLFDKEQMAEFAKIQARVHKERLFALYQKHPSLVGGEPGKGEIGVVTDPNLIATIEAMMQANFVKKGIAPEDAFEWSRVGVVSQDGYFINVRDAVIFPNGAQGLYNRQLERSALGGTQGAVALPLVEGGKILFNMTYRHATRDWGMELARGFSKPGEPHIQTARRELEEETGMKSDNPISLGIMVANTGIGATKPAMFVCPITGEGKLDRGKEAISKCIPFSLQEVADALVSGYFLHDGKQVPFIDGFSFCAIAKAHAAGLIQLPVGKGEQPYA